MNFSEQNLRLYAVTDRAWTGRLTLLEQVEAALQGGATCVQLREKQLDRDAFLAEACRMAELCHRYGVPFLVNDDLDIALASGADGVHVGQDDLPVAEVRRRAGSRLIVGVSAHNVREALAAQEGGADYLGAGAVFGTATKKNVTPADPPDPVTDLPGRPHPGGGHRRRERRQPAAAGGHRRGGGGGGIRHLRCAGHHRRLPAAADPLRDGGRRPARSLLIFSQGGSLPPRGRPGAPLSAA